MNIIRRTASFLTILGALNWGLIGFFGFNLVTALFGGASLLTQIIYMLIGISAIISIFDLPYFRVKTEEK